jgi:hypothetical protein
MSREAHTPAKPSRRAYTLGLLAAAIAPAALLVRSTIAEESRWRVYRREDLGFQIEMPGDPMEDTAPPEDVLLTMVNIMFANEDALFAVNHQEYAKPFALKGEMEIFRLAMQELGTPIERESAMSIDGVDAAEVVTELTITRIVVVKNYRILVAAHGNDRDVHKNAAVRRFLGSFKLLPRR